jgi:hypothetical protein
MELEAAEQIPINEISQGSNGGICVKQRIGDETANEPISEPCDSVGNVSVMIYWLA